MDLVADTNSFNRKTKLEELDVLLRKYIPAVEIMRGKLKKYDTVYRELKEENALLEKKLDAASRDSIHRRLEIHQKLSEFEELKRAVEGIPPELLVELKQQQRKEVELSR